jgi:hypothetical protein
MLKVCNVSDLLCWLIPPDMKLFIFNKFSESISMFGKHVIQFPMLSVMDDGKKNGRRGVIELNWSVNPVGALYSLYF